jgi:thioredoxin-related protein
MKKIITLVLLSLFLFSCTNKNVEEKTNLDINNKTDMYNYKE